MDAPAPVLLRPLGVGEIIDRALTLCVRNFVPFALTLLVMMAIPYAIGDYLATKAEGDAFPSLSNLLPHMLRPMTPLHQHLPQVVSYPALYLGFTLVLVSAFLRVFAENSIAVSVADLYAGRRPRVWSSLGATLGKSSRLIGLIALGVLVFIVAYVVLFVMAMLSTIGIMGTSTILPGTGRSPVVMVVLVLLAGLVILALMAAAALLLIAFAFAGYAIVIEDRSVMAALGSGIERIFNRAEWGRAILIALVTLLISLGISLIAWVVQEVLLLLPFRDVFVVIAATLFTVVAAVVQTVFLAVYYYDVRVRREGLDLEVALERLAPSAS